MGVFFLTWNNTGEKTWKGMILQKCKMVRNSGYVAINMIGTCWNSWHIFCWPYVNHGVLISRHHSWSNGVLARFPHGAIRLLPPTGNYWSNEPQIFCGHPPHQIALNHSCLSIPSAAVFFTRQKITVKILIRSDDHCISLYTPQFVYGFVWK